MKFRKVGMDTWTEYTQECNENGVTKEGDCLFCQFVFDNRELFTGEKVFYVESDNGRKRELCPFGLALICRRNK